MKRKLNIQESNDGIQYKIARCDQSSNNRFSDLELTRHRTFFVKHMGLENFNKIKKYFSRFSQEDIEYLFEQKGRSILSWQINVENSNLNRLDFIFKNVPHAAIKRVLYQRDCHVAKSFLDISLQREKRGADSDAIRKIRISKFEFMIHFMELNTIEKIFSEKNITSKKIMEDLNAARNVYIPQTIINLSNQSLRP